MLCSPSKSPTEKGAIGNGKKFQLSDSDPNFSKLKEKCENLSNIDWKLNLRRITQPIFNEEFDMLENGKLNSTEIQTRKFPS